MKGRYNMETVFIVFRKDYLKTEPIIAFDNEEDANDFADLLERAMDRTVDVFYAPFAAKKPVLYYSGLVGRTENA